MKCSKINKGEYLVLNTWFVFIYKLAIFPSQQNIQVSNRKIIKRKKFEKKPEKKYYMLQRYSD